MLNLFENAARCGTHEFRLLASTSYMQKIHVYFYVCCRYAHSKQRTIGPLFAATYVTQTGVSV